LIVSFFFFMEPLTIHSRKDNTAGRPLTPEAHTDTYEVQQRDDRPPQDSFFVEVLKFSVLALLIVVPFRVYIAQPFIVNGASMDPTFDTGEYLIVDQLSYRLEEPKRGDVVIFRYPNDPQQYFIKRIIGLPGEVVELSNGETVIIDPITEERVTLTEPYLRTDRTDTHVTTTLSSDEYYVMGDNRSRSSDSREWGPVPRENLVGRAFLRLLPPQHFAIFPGTCTYQDIHDATCTFK